MKKRITLLVALSVFVLGCAVPRLAGAQDRKAESKATPPTPEERARGAEAMKGLRNKWLTTKADELPLEGADAKAKVWGAMMEMALDVDGAVVVATVVSFVDGTASLYTTSGFGASGKPRRSRPNDSSRRPRITSPA